MSDRLFANFGSGSSYYNGSPQQEDVITRLLLQQHQINQAQLEQQQREQRLTSFGSASLFLILNKQNEGQSLSQLLPSHGSNNNLSQRSMSLTQHRASMASSGLGNSQHISSASCPVASGPPRTTCSQSTGGFSSSMEPGIHSIPTSSCCQAIRDGSPLFSNRDSGSLTLEQLQLMMSCQRDQHGDPSVNPLYGSESMKQQQKALEQFILQAQIKAALQQNEGGGGASHPSLQTSTTNVQNLQDLANIQNLQNLPGLQAIAGNAGIGGNSNLERPAPMYCNPTCTWSATYTLYSRKVFLGGTPRDITEVELINAFKQFGSIKVEWPGNPDDANRRSKGCAYVIFDDENAVDSLLNNKACTRDGKSYYYKISSRRIDKDVEVIPWIISNNSYPPNSPPNQRLDKEKTVFVGALHGKLNAEGLAHIMKDLFGGVLHARLDTDKYKYPMGSGRVTFDNNRSYMKAVAATFIDIKTSKFTKKMQVDPYLMEDSLCASCNAKEGPYFCRDLNCFNYFCPSCWQLKHNSDLNKHHRPLIRRYKGARHVAGSGSPGGSNSSSSPFAHQNQ